jgi:RNA-directed DNA polymerase
MPVEEIVEDVNLFLRGWAGYFRYGNSANHLKKIRNYALSRVGIFVPNQHDRSRNYGWHAVVYLSPDNMGGIKLDGSVVAPQPIRPWQGKPNAVGEGCR